jgi:hypothetical protein
MTGPTVLRFDATAEQAEYRSAVEQIIRDIQKATEHTLVDIAENIGVSENTIANAVHKRSDLSALYLRRLGKVYGGGFLNPYFSLVDGQYAPIEGNEEANLGPLVAKVNLKLVEASDPTGPGGTAHVPQERSAYLPDLKAMHRETAQAIREIEAVLA